MCVMSFKDFSNADVTNSSDKIVTLFRRGQTAIPDAQDEDFGKSPSLFSFVESIASTSKISLQRKPKTTKANAIVARTLSPQEEIAEIINSKKIFSISNFFPMYTFPLLQSELVKRGWLEKLNHDIYTSNTTICKRAYHTHLPQMLHNVKPNFIWSSQAFNKLSYGEDCPLHSRLAHRQTSTNFASKLGLCNLQSKVHWFKYQATPSLVMPRTYAISDEAARQAFSNDYRLTMCMGFLHDLLNMDLRAVLTTEGFHSTDMINFAIRIVRSAVAEKRHKDIDDLDEGGEGPPLHHEMFEVYNKEFRRIIVNGETIKVANDKNAEIIVSNIFKVINDAVQCFPTVIGEGCNDLWILKPAGSKFGCGYGIILYNTEKDILGHCDSYPATLFIVQKYLERPLLIYKTKFDIRQYFLLVMDDNNLNVWMYKNCYLKFSGQEFKLDDFSRAIHVTNHTVQREFKNGARSPHLPPHNMWVLQEFKDYLEKIGEPDKWSEQIYPELVGCIKSVLEGTLEGIDFNKNNFQLFGADFMITYDYHPVLLEINAAPDLRFSTVSTKVVCAAVVKDMVKVLVDLPMNPKSSTGDFERICRIQFLDYCPIPNPKFEVIGTKCILNDPESVAAKQLECIKSKDNQSPQNEVTQPINNAEKKTEPLRQVIPKNIRVDRSPVRKRPVHSTIHPIRTLPHDRPTSSKAKKEIKEEKPISKMERIGMFVNNLNSMYDENASQSSVTSTATVNRDNSLNKKRTSMYATPTPNLKQFKLSKALGGRTYICESSCLIMDYMRRLK